MEMEEIQNACKMSRIGNNKIGLLAGVARNNYQDDNNNIDVDDAGKIESNSRLRAWHSSSRIFRVSRASGGKDRHSKVLTAKGLRDRRVRLSVSTAIQFYDLQDRLGYDQPSKAVEWLINAAADAISELPSLESRFPDTTSKQGFSDEDEKRICVAKARFDTELLESSNNDPANNVVGFQQQHISMSKSACSSTSETSKGSVLSLSRTEIRVKARERARERAAKDKDKEQQIDGSPGGNGHQQNSHNASFTELLNSGGGGGGNNQSSPSQSAQPAANFFFKQARHSSPPMDCFHGGGGGMYGGQTPSSSRNNFSGFSTQFGLSPSTHNMTLPPSFTLTSDQPHHHHHHSHPHHSELQQFSFLPDHLIPDAPQPISVVSGNDYNLNFSIAGYNRGTLQSNSPSSLPPQQHLQRFADGTNMPFYVGNNNNPTNAENHHVPAGFDGRLQLYYGDGSRHSDTKGKDHKR